MNKNEQYDVTIEDVGANGEGICHVDGITVFVPFVLPNEKCKIHILKVKDNIAYAKVIEIFEKSNARVEPLCPVFGKCGGCSLQHASAEFELDSKKKQIQTCFKKYAGVQNLDVQMIDSNLEFGYRNKCAFPVRTMNGVARVCMFKQNSHSGVEIQSCPLAHGLINRVVKVFSKWLEKFNVSAFDEKENKGVVKFLVCRVLGNRVLVTVVINGTKLGSIEKFAQMLEEDGIEFGLNLNINKTNNNVILTDKFLHVCGIRELEGCENEIKYPVSSLSFMQVNDYIKTQIYNKAISSIHEGSVVIDAYSGAGLMSAMLARCAKHVYGIEIVGAATKNADELARKNDVKNLTNINGDCAEKLPELVKSLQGETVEIVLDPPRKGCDKKVLDAVVASAPQRVLYISCNPATLARDAKVLLDGGFEINEVSGFNMFPKTSHVETVAIFERKE
ncbi:MAG: 23S rRNA (uracil(1939)-C(5))-methyltransferase RlmD [Clostridia bacterium]|nr:23S rRNA (uracil(1939)-C(5))-methyltransferase RlmD [Clostridia bacterium]